MTTLDGTTYRFGGTANSRAEEWLTDGNPGGRRITYAWWLDTVTDLQTTPNQITYTYLHDTAYSYCGTADENWAYDGGIYPQTIRYNGTLTEIGFTYATRADVRRSSVKNLCAMPVQTQAPDPNCDLDHRGGRPRNSSAAMSSTISTRPASPTVDTFPGVWQQPGQFGRLTLWSITEYDASGYALPATTFTYPANRLGQVSNGLGGTVTYNYETVPFATSPTSTGVRGWSFPGDGYSTAGVSWSEVNTWNGGMALFVATSGEQAVQFYLGEFIPGATYCFSAYTEGSVRLAARFTVDGVDSEPTIMGWSGSGTGTRTGCATVPHRSDKAWFLIYVNGTATIGAASADQVPTYHRLGEPDRFRWPGHDQHVHVHLRQRGDERFGPLGRRSDGRPPPPARHAVPRARDGHGDRSDRGRARNRAICRTMSIWGG